jgi:hypothetical protein
MRTSRWTVVASVVIMGGMAVGPALAGDLDSPAAPTDPVSARFTLGDLYTRLFDGTAGTKRAGAFVEPVAGPGTATMYSTDDIHGNRPGGGRYERGGGERGGDGEDVLGFAIWELGIADGNGFGCGVSGAGGGDGAGDVLRPGDERRGRLRRHRSGR